MHPPLTFTFDLSQQHFQISHGTQSRRLAQPELLQLIEDCEQAYYSGRPTDWRGQPRDVPADLVALGRRLYQWLDGDEGWLRSPLGTGLPQTIAFQLNPSLEVQGLNPQTDRIALGLAHLPWELLHDGKNFLLQTQAIALPPIRIVQQHQGTVEPINRPLHLLLMATSPDGIEPVLSYEQEESNIVQATENQPLLLVVEESGSVGELANLIRYYPDGYFDVFHLTGHGLIFTQENYGGLVASIQPPPPIAENTPCMITEDDLGNVQLTTVPDLARAFGDRFPRIVFLSGCHTGEVPDRGSVPSMAQALVKAGAQIVLGWARPVFDQTAIVAAQAIYKELAAGSGPEQAVKLAVAEMIRQKCPDWHLLRVYCDSRSLTPLVTPMGTPRRERLARIQPEQDFLDAQDQVKVASPFEFIGRRRSLQRCLRVMKPTGDRVGVFIQGMGGLGKSTLAARLCRRVQAQRPFQRVVLVGVVNEATLLQKLSSAYEQFAEIPKLLNEPGLTLKGRLQNFIAAVEEIDRPLLLVLDDFEQNIPQSAIEDGTLRPITAASDVLTALCGALDAMQQEMSAASRLIVTCRYRCPHPSSLQLEELNRMNATDIDKKCRLLPDYGQVRRHPLYDRVIEVADGNPRLLEWLLKLLQQPEVDSEALLNQLAEKEAEFRENILAETLLASLTPEERTFLARLSVFRLPVTREIVDAVVETSAADRTLSRLLGLSLLESATSPSEREYRVTSVLEPLLEPALSEEEWRSTQATAAQAIYRTWWQEAESSTEAQRLEMVRLALLGGEGTIAVEVGDRVATSWINNSRFLEALELCQLILNDYPNHYRISGTIAHAEEVLGFVDESVNHYLQAIDSCPDDDLQERATMLNNIALVVVRQGNVNRALELWQQSLEIRERIGDDQGKAVTLNNMANSAYRQGNDERALKLWQQSLEIQERIDDVQGKATTLNNMALVAAQRGDSDCSLNLWQQSLEISEYLCDVRGKATTLNNMALEVARRGNITSALNLWQQSLEIQERIGDLQGKAATLNNISEVFYYQREFEKAAKLLEQSTQALGQARAYGDLVTVLINLAAIAEKGNWVYLAQAVWLCLRIQAPLQQTLSILKDLFNTVPQGDELEALLAAYALFLCAQRGQGHPQLESLQKLGLQMLSGAAGAQGIETQEAFEAWFAQQQLNDPTVFLPRLNQRLEAMIGDSWVFDPAPLRSPVA